MRKILILLMLMGCAGTWTPPEEFTQRDVATGNYEIMTYQKITDRAAPIHIYIEGDGHAFDARGKPTRDPTPRGTLMRDLAARDTSANVAYVARPCQFIMSPSCTVSDWTDGRFSANIVDATATAIRKIAGRRPVILVGYSGGGLLAGLVINRHPEIKVKKWITIAAVPNHAAWTEYFGDAPLTRSLDLTTTPRIPAVHYIGERDRVVPPELSRRFFPATKIRVVPGAGHDDFMDLNIDFD